MKLFDCHCHVHLGPRGVAPLLEIIPSHPSEESFAGAAVMSTHPRDYPIVDEVVSALREKPACWAVPCYGVHPWFLHEVLQLPETENAVEHNELRQSNDPHADDWVVELKRRLIDHPDAIVGEIGLDGARWREGGDGERMLSCPMDLQQQAFERQLILAAELQRPVSIHVVRAWGELFDSFTAVMEAMEQRRAAEEVTVATDESEITRKHLKKTKGLLLPPKIYFHAFSGKAGVLPSILACCAKGNVPREDVYFGFPPAIRNFYSPKTPSIVRNIGIDQLVLETDLEDGTKSWDDLKRGVVGLSGALSMDAFEVAKQTYKNAERLYGHTTQHTA